MLTDVSYIIAKKTGKKSLLSGKYKWQTKSEVKVVFDLINGL